MDTGIMMVGIYLSGAVISWGVSIVLVAFDTKIEELLGHYRDWGVAAVIVWPLFWGVLIAFLLFVGMGKGFGLITEKAITVIRDWRKRPSKYDRAIERDLIATVRAKQEMVNDTSDHKQKSTS